MTEVVQNLRNFLNDIANEQGYGNAQIDVQAVSTEGANYTTGLYVVTISAPPKEDLKLFAKVANLSESVRAANYMYEIIYEKEYKFYSELVVAFEKLYNKNGVPKQDRLYIPKFYGYKNTKLEEKLVLENLAARGFKSFDRKDTFDWEYASTSVGELAKFHALGLAFRNENIEEFERICNNLVVDIFANKRLMEPLLSQAIKMGTEVIKEEFRDRMRKYFESNNLLDGIEKLWSPCNTGLLMHGDYRPNNLMHRTVNGKLEVVPLDYQCFHLGTLAADLMSFIWMGSDAEFRKKYYEKLLEHYYTELSRALQNLHVDVDKVYPRNTFEKELEDTKTIGLFIGLALMSALTVDPKDVPDLESFDNLKVEPNQLAKDRMNGIVGDYARWGII